MTDNGTSSTTDDPTRETTPSKYRVRMRLAIGELPVQRHDSGGGEEGGLELVEVDRLPLVVVGAPLRTGRAVLSTADEHRKRP